jgi:hypothetical protein
MACDSPISVKWGEEGIYLPLPCGKCSPCIKRRIDAWVFRCEQEDRVSRSSHFLTLTYAPESLPWTNPDRPKYDENFPTLKKRHFQLFMKRLRKTVNKEFPNTKIKYYACGEYGEAHKRPHYHAVIFNCPSPTYYATAWSHISDQTEERVQKGLIHVGQVTNNSIAYVAAYMQKNTGRAPWPGAEKEFALYSRGLGSSYLISGYDSCGRPEYTPAYYYHRKHPHDLFLIRPGGHRIAMPRYFRNIIWSEEERSAQIPYIHDAVNRQLEESREQLTARGKDWSKEEREARKARKRKYDRKLMLKSRNYE